MKAAPLLPARPEVHLTSVSQLKDWASSLGVTRAPIRLRFGQFDLSQPEQLRWQQQIERLHNDCGCSAASASLVGLNLAVIAYAVLVGFEQSLWLVVLGTVAASVVALFVGKIIGKAWSRRKLRRQVAQLSHVVEGRAANEPFP